MSAAIETPTPAAIAGAADRLRAGLLVAFPTETVYGLGADAGNPEAVRRIFVAKGRPADHPVIVHLDDAAEIAHWARSVPEAARRLAATFWPGPLTLILPRASHVSDIVTGGQDSVGLRVPSHPVARALLAAFGGGIAAPSANRFGRISPTTAAHVADDLGDAVASILDGGACDVGIESTIVAFRGETPILLRPGGIGVGRAVARARGAARRSGRERAARVGHARLPLRAEDPGEPRRARRAAGGNCPARRARRDRRRARAHGRAARRLRRRLGRRACRRRDATRTISTRTCARSTPRTRTSSSSKRCPTATPGSPCATGLLRATRGVDDDRD